jgi:3',5'-cyclic AMP phosphodiesterase CpdA
MSFAVSVLLSGALSLSCRSERATNNNSKEAPSPERAAESLAGPPDAAVAGPPDPKPEGATRVVLSGDFGVGAEARTNLDWITSLKPDLVVLLGDFDYDDRPGAWEKLLSRLGDVPWVAVVGNHDLPAFGAYQRHAESFQRRYADKTGCKGTALRQTSCSLGPLRLVLSEIGTMGNARENLAFLERELVRADEPFRICAWHKNQADLQVGYKNDEVGYEAFHICQKHGALVVSGHEHSYSRTRVLTRVGDRGQAHGAVGPFDELSLAPGRTAVVVAGLGGVGIRAYAPRFHDDDRWWATYVTRDRVMRAGRIERHRLEKGYSGALVLDLGLERRANVGRGYFVLAQSRRVMDRFELTTRPAAVP